MVLTRMARGALRFLTVVGDGPGMRGTPNIMFTARCRFLVCIGIVSTIAKSAVAVMVATLGVGKV